MKDTQIIELFFQRVEEAITRLSEKYGAMCLSIAQRILWDERDCEECVNDAYVQTWNTIPPQRPTYLSGFVGRITRNPALNRLDYNRAQKRDFALEKAFWELSGSLPDPGDTVTGEVVFHDFLARFLHPVNDIFAVPGRQLTQAPEGAQNIHYNAFLLGGLVPGQLYSLSMDSGASQESLLALAVQLFAPAQDEL